MTQRAAIYARISLDRKEGAGVARQLADCRALAAERGYEIVGEYIDNDVSAVRAKRRPRYDEMVASLSAVDVLVAHHPDRLYRTSRDLEDLIDATEGVEIVTVKAGDMDLGDATGRMLARLLGATSRHESDRIGERVSRAKRDRVARGLHPGGGVRAFGWKADKVALEPVEAKALKAAAERVAAGGPVRAEARALNRAGLLTPTGNEWTGKSLGRVLKSPRLAGIATYKGAEVGRAAWAPIVDEATHRRIVLMLEGRDTRRRGPRTPSLLSALIACPKCGGRLYVARGNRPTAYVCAPGGGGCAKSSIVADAADRAVIAAVDAWLADPGIPAAAGPVRSLDVSAELEAIAVKRRDLTRRWTLGNLTDDEYDEAIGWLTQRTDELGEAPAPVIDLDLERVRKGWEGGVLEVRRALIEQVVVIPIRLKPGRMTDPADRLIVEIV